MLKTEDGGVASEMRQASPFPTLISDRACLFADYNSFQLPILNNFSLTTKLAFTTLRFCSCAISAAVRTTRHIDIAVGIAHISASFAFISHLPACSETVGSTFAKNCYAHESSLLLYQVKIQRSFIKSA